MNGAVAMPVTLVAAVIVLVLFENVPPTPEAGALNVTLTPEARFPYASVTVTARALAKVVFSKADCGVVPALAVIKLAGPGRLVMLKLVETPAPAEAVSE